MQNPEPLTTGAPQGVPLAGIRVVDLTRLLPGPMCTAWARARTRPPPRGSAARSQPSHGASGPSKPLRGRGAQPPYRCTRSRTPVEQ